MTSIPLGVKSAGKNITSKVARIAYFCLITLCPSWPPPPLLVPPKWPQNFFYQTFLKTVQYMVHCLRIVAMTLLVAPPWHVLRTGQRVNGMLSVQYCTDSIALRYVQNTSQNHELSLILSKICLNGHAVFSLSADVVYRLGWMGSRRRYGAPRLANSVGTMPLGTVYVCVCVNRMSEWWTRPAEDCV